MLVSSQVEIKPDIKKYVESDKHVSYFATLNVKPRINHEPINLKAGIFNARQKSNYNTAMRCLMKLRKYRHIPFLPPMLPTT